MITPCVKRTRQGETIFAPYPFLSAKALVTWATAVYGHSLHCVEGLEKEWVTVDMPGLTRLTYAPGNINEI
jgi:hypothetical protein